MENFCKSATIPLLAALLTACDPPIDNPLFDSEDIALLNEGGTIASTHPKLAGADELCLIGPDNLSGYEFNGCVLTTNQSIALIHEGVCTHYSVDGFEGRVHAQHDRECRSINSGFRLGTIDRYGTKHLIFRD